MAEVLRKAHQCNNCSKSFSSSHQLAQHARIHSNEKPYKCGVCDKSFKQLSHLQQHSRLHSGERPYKCTELNCGRTFIQLSNLQQHQKTHSNGYEKQERSEKRYVNSTSCPVCSKSYVNEGSLRKHIQTTHGDVLNSLSFNNNSNSSQSQPNNNVQQQQQINFLLSCTPDTKGQTINATQVTNNSANNLFLINSNNNNAILQLTSRVLVNNNRTSNKKN